ncbi:MAG: hypothetical protein ABSG35_22260 [Syntrophobacteraceae bacterium]
MVFIRVLFESRRWGLHNYGVLVRHEDLFLPRLLAFLWIGRIFKGWHIVPLQELIQVGFDDSPVSPRRFVCLEFTGIYAVNESLRRNLAINPGLIDC